MSKTKEELDALKEEVEAVNEKLAELTPEEIAQVNGGGAYRHIAQIIGDDNVGDKLAAAGKAIGIGLSHGSIDGPAAIR